MPIFHKNRQNLQTAKTDKSQQILQDKTTETHSIFCQDLENAVEPKTKKSAFFAAKKSTPINKKHPQKNLTSNKTPTPAPRKKFLKIFAAASLALITCATTLLATAPFGTSTANAAAETNQNNTTQTSTSNGLITPQEDDPVLFKTEFGLTIKIGNAAVSTLSTSNLVGFPYFVADGYTWVIIGRSTTDFTDVITYESVNYYASEISNSPIINNAVVKDISSAAGNIISNEIQNDYCASTNGAMDIQLSTINTTSIQTNIEIPVGCVLCLLNEPIDSGGGASPEYFSYYTNAAHGWYCSTIKSVMDNYYTSNLLGIASFKTRIQARSITTSGYGVWYDEGMNVGGLHSVTQNNCYIFPLSKDGSFKYSNYLTAEQIKLSTNQWLSDSSSSGSYNVDNRYQYYYRNYIDTNGSPKSMTNNNSADYRPACVLKLTP